MKIMWTNKYSKEQGYVKAIHKEERYFENTFDLKEAVNFPKKLVNGAIEFLNECCTDNEYSAV